MYFRKLLEEMAGRMDLLKAHCAARTIQKAWRIHRRVRTRKVGRARDRGSNGHGSRVV